MGKEIELTDLVDANGIIKKQGIPRNEIDSYPDLHLQIAIAVIFNKSGEILVQKRAIAKSSEAGKIDHVCGSVISGETPEEAAIRESKEETGIDPNNVKVVDKGLNKYNRYRYLLVGESDSQPGQFDLNEVEWVKFIPLEELEKKEASGEFEFVGEFFEDTEIAIQSLRK